MSESNKDKAHGRKYGKATSYEDSPAQVKKREQRNKARRKMVKAGKAHKGDGNDVDHVAGLGGGNVSSNLKVKSKHKNRAYKRNSDHTQKR